MTEILLGIADVLLAVIAFKMSVSSRSVAMFMAMQKSDPESAAPLIGPVEGDGIVDTESEYVIQERYIDEWVATNCDQTHDESEKQHQRWEGLRHYKNRTKR